MKHKGKIFGFVLFVAIIITTIVLGSHNTKPTSTAAAIEQITLKGLIGGEKEELFNDPAFNKVLKDKYGITLDFAKSGSLDMVKDDNLSKNDFIFPASQTAADIAKSKVKGAVAVNVFSSPLVIYSWQPIVDKLTVNKIVEVKDGTAYVTDFQKLMKLVLDNKKWSDIGLPELFGNVSVITSDPVQTNSGSVFAALLANTFNDQNVVDETTLDKSLPQVIKIFTKLGFMQSSTTDLFSQYLKTGIGSDPIIVGYENQIVGFSINNPDIWAKLQSKVKILYPEPTIWSNHIFVSLNPKAKLLNTALMDPEIQKIAWERHGFRTGVAGLQNDTTVLAVKGIPDQITKVMQMPTTETMKKLIAALQ